jgi:hypothetical protein
MSYEITVDDIKKYINNNILHPIESVNLTLICEIEKVVILSQDEDIVSFSINFMKFNVSKSDILIQLREDKLNKLLDDN